MNSGEDGIDGLAEASVGRAWASTVRCAMCCPTSEPESRGIRAHGSRRHTNRTLAFLPLRRAGCNLPDFA